MPVFFVKCYIANVCTVIYACELCGSFRQLLYPMSRFRFLKECLWRIWRSEDRASLYFRVIEDNKMHYFSILFWYTTLHLSDRLTVHHSDFGGLEVACWPLVPKFAGSHRAEAVGFLGRKNPQHAFFRKGSKAVGPMS
jgi:hypothetical protein